MEATASQALADLERHAEAAEAARAGLARNPDAVGLLYPRCAGGAEVQLYVVKGGGHTWPPHRPQVTAGGAATGDLDATRVIVDSFFPQG